MPTYTPATKNSASWSQIGEGGQAYLYDDPLLVYNEGSPYLYDGRGIAQVYTPGTENSAAWSAASKS